MLRKITTIILLFLSLCSYAQMEKPYACIMINDSLEFKGGEIEDKTLLLNVQGLAVKPQGIIVEYKTAIEKDGKLIINSYSQGNQFGQKEKKLFKNLTEGQVIYIYEIMALTSPSGLKRILCPIEIIYKPKDK